MDFGNSGSFRKNGLILESDGTELGRSISDPLPPYSAGPHQSYLVDYWRMLVKYRWLILASAVVTVTMAIIVSVRTTRMYEARGRIAIYKEQAENLGINSSKNAVAESDWDPFIDLDTQVKVLESDLLALQVIRELKLVKTPAFGGGSEETLLSSFRNALKVVVIPRTRVVEISFLSPDPKFAAQAVNTISNAYIDQNFKTRFEATQRVSEWLTKQLADLQVKVEISQEKLVRYQQAKGILGLDEKQNIVTSKLDELNKDLTEAESDRIQKEAVYRMAAAGDAEHIAKLDSSVLLDRMRGQEADLRTQLADINTQFGPSYPKHQEVQNQLLAVQANIKQEVERIAQRMKSEYTAALQREGMLRAALEAQKQEANQLNESAIEYNLLKRDLDTNRLVYEGLLQELKEAGITAGLRSSNVRIIDVARVPDTPATPNIPRNIELGLLLGVIGGMALAMVLETFDNTVRTPEQVEFIAGLPSLGIIPLLAGRDSPHSVYPSSRLPSTVEQDLGGTELISHSRPKSQMAESYRALRTSILLSAVGGPPKTLLITSSLPREGKTTTSVNMAIVLAQKGGRVLLIDADLRRPNVGKVLHLDQSSGLSTVLAGGDKFESVVRQIPFIPNLFVLPAGPLPPQPAELLGSDQMRELIAQLREQYDYVIIDTSPMLTVTDPVLLSVDMDAVVLVIRAAQTTKHALRRSRELLARVNARVLGVVVNGVDMRSVDSHYYSYYHYESKDGGGYYDMNTVEAEASRKNA
jgi:polysaccharide biosynthesis transport protein